MFKALDTLVSIRIISLFIVDALVISILVIPSTVLILLTKPVIICCIIRNIKYPIINPLAIGNPTFSIRSKASIYYLLLILSLAVPAYKPNQAAPAPTTIEIKPDCSNDGSGKFINHIVHLYKRTI